MSQLEMPYTSKDGTEHYEADGFVWSRRINATAVRLTGTGTLASARVVAIWDAPINSPEIPPGNVRVTRAASDDETRRGVTSSVLRDAERLLVRLTAAMPPQVAGLTGADPRVAIEESARRLPPGPRGYPTYYQSLLKVYRKIIDLQVANPVKVLCEVTGKPEGTIKLHLRRAREEAAAK